MKNLKQWLPDIVAVVLFAVISFAYFFPADIEERITCNAGSRYTTRITTIVNHDSVTSSVSTITIVSVFCLSAIALNSTASDVQRTRFLIDTSRTSDGSARNINISFTWKIHADNTSPTNGLSVVPSMS